MRRWGAGIFAQQQYSLFAGQYSKRYSYKVPCACTQETLATSSTLGLFELYFYWVAPHVTVDTLEASDVQSRYLAVGMVSLFARIAAKCEGTHACLQPVCRTMHVHDPYYVWLRHGSAGDAVRVGGATLLNLFAALFGADFLARTCNCDQVKVAPGAPQRRLLPIFFTCTATKCESQLCGVV